MFKASSKAHPTVVCCEHRCPGYLPFLAFIFFPDPSKILPIIFPWKQKSMETNFLFPMRMRRFREGQARGHAGQALSLQAPPTITSHFSHLTFCNGSTEDMLCVLNPWFLTQCHLGKQDAAKVEHQRRNFDGDERGLWARTFTYFSITPRMGPEAGIGGWRRMCLYHIWSLPPFLKSDCFPSNSSLLPWTLLSLPRLAT